ncbi:MAG: AAA family ATPase [Candidatus Tectomicrobia bacterium]|uniref:AAA family ATPase n=1 Tax=Tectimicrobiota bacterium TaxID=2528274 RepID=A0A933LQU0_UNCTE|nr:AAA family ATPase [Candidatus Tectomicrobia bacterium]
MSNEDLNKQIPLSKLIGASGSGKSTFARKYFLSTEILSSDHCRALVSDDENNLEVTAEAFEVLDFIAGKRLAGGKLTVIDATNVQAEARKPLVKLARQYHCLPVAIVFDLPESVCIARNKERKDRNFGSRVILQHTGQLRRSIKNLKREGFRHIFILNSTEEVDGVTIIREALWNDKTACHGPFDIIGDVHGCFDELVELLETLGYQVVKNNVQGPVDGPVYAHPQGRVAVFLGDIVDRGPRIADTLKLIYNMCAHRSAFCVPGNHDMKLLRKLQGRDVQVNFGLAESLSQIEQLPDSVRGKFSRIIAEFLDGLVSHYVLVDKKLVVAHAGLKAEMQGRGSAKVREFCLYGETTGETDEFGLPERYNWAAGYRGQSMVIYGHTPIPKPEWLNNTLNIDTGCVFGGKLTAFRYPEKELISVPAKLVYCEPVSPRKKEEPEVSALSTQQKYDDLKLAPFHLLTTKGQLYVNRNHEWHMESLTKICRMDEGLLLATPYKIVDVTNPESTIDGIQWWEESTGQGAEGMVIKPYDFISNGKRGLVQPALKCRGREYLRIIYGPEYTLEDNLKRLRSRELKAKRSLALREFALGIEAMERFVRKEPLRKIHECVFGILALESEPVDPRL